NLAVVGAIEGARTGNRAVRVRAVDTERAVGVCPAALLTVRVINLSGRVIKDRAAGVFGHQDRVGRAVGDGADLGNLVALYGADEARVVGIGQVDQAEAIDADEVLDGVERVVVAGGRRGGDGRVGPRLVEGAGAIEHL